MLRATTRLFVSNPERPPGSKQYSASVKILMGIGLLSTFAIGGLLLYKGLAITPPDAPSEAMVESAKADMPYFCDKVPSFPGDRRTNTDKLSFMHINGEFLFSPQFVREARANGRKVTLSFPNLEAHAQSIAQIIEKYNPDVVNLCEISDCSALELVRQYLKNAGAYKSYVTKQFDQQTLQACGMITKVDPLAIQSFKRSDKESISLGPSCAVEGYDIRTGNKTLSKAYKAKFLVNGIPIGFLGAHLVAFPGIPQRCAEREAQARILLREIYSTKFFSPGEEIILMGDLNDMDWDYAPEPSAKEPRSNVLKILKSAGLESVLSKVPSDRRFTSITPKFQKRFTRSTRFSIIDHALLSKRVFQATSFAEVGSFYRSWSSDRCTDHYPIIFEIDMKQLKAKRDGADAVIPTTTRERTAFPPYESLPGCSALFPKLHASSNVILAADVPNSQITLLTPEDFKGPDSY